MLKVPSAMRFPPFFHLLSAVPAVLMFGLQPASAQDRDFSANRPGLGTPPTTLEPGGVMVEAGVLGWDHSGDASGVDDTLTAGDLTLRMGLTERAELQLGFTSYVRDRLRDRASGAVSVAGSTGDATIALRRGLAGPNGPVALEGFVTLPVGKSPGGAGDWGAGVLLPMAINLPQGFQLGLTPEADAAVNASGSGHHLAFGSVFGLSHALGKTVSGALEAGVMRDNDPAGHETQARLAASLAWQVTPKFQLDIEADARVTGGVPDHALMFGFARRIR